MEDCGSQTAAGLVVSKQPFVIELSFAALINLFGSSENVNYSFGRCLRVAIAMLCDRHPKSDRENYGELQLVCQLVSTGGGGGGSGDGEHGFVQQDIVVSSVELKNPNLSCGGVEEYREDIWGKKSLTLG